MSCGGASQQQKAMGAQQEATAQTLNQAFNSRFAGQDEILNKLNKAYTATISAGPNGAGFDSATRRALDARALDTTAANYGNAARAVNQQLAGRGGDTGILSGVDAQIKGAIAAESAKTLSGEQRDIGIQDALLGQQKYQSALTGMQELSGQYNPAQFGSEAMTAQKQAYDTQKSIDSQKGGFWKTLGGIAGAATSFIPGVGPGISAGIKGLTGMFSNGSNLATAGAGQRADYASNLSDLGGTPEEFQNQ